MRKDCDEYYKILQIKVLLQKIITKKKIQVRCDTFIGRGAMISIERR